MENLTDRDNKYLLAADVFTQSAFLFWVAYVVANHSEGSSLFLILALLIAFIGIVYALKLAVSGGGLKVLRRLGRQ